VGKLFDFMAGISTICEIAKVPLTAGSTLRIGGDMVIGNRLVGGIGGVGIASTNLFARRNIKPGDKILMTEGAGGGTISTTAIYSGYHEVVKETMNIKFLEACKLILNSDYKDNIHAMCDVTNGGLRGDLYEINYEANCGVTVFEEKIRKLVNPKVLKLLEQTGVDYLGVSLDALLIYCSEDTSSKIIKGLREKNIECAEIGYVDDSKKISIVFQDKQIKKVLPKFRESAYTKIKKVIGEKAPQEKEAMEKSIEETAKKALIKRKKIIDYIKHLS
jgi:hydrogenase expression/formation protein